MLYNKIDLFSSQKPLKGIGIQFWVSNSSFFLNWRLIKLTEFINDPPIKK